MITFAEFIVALDARAAGAAGQYTAHCPVPSHGKGRGDRSPSFSITQRDGRILIHCFGGCRQDAVLEFLTGRDLWPVATDEALARQARIDEHAAKLDLPAGLIEFDTKLIDPTNGVVDRYLAARGLDVRELADIRQHPKAWHAPTDSWWPCLVAGVRDVDDRLRSLDRTWLHHLDPPRKAPVTPNRMLYGGAPCAGCSIHLAPAADQLLLGEGIESTASAMKLFGLPGWAAMSADNLARGVPLPAVVHEVVIAADNDPPGLRGAIAAAQRFKREGRQVRIVKPDICGDFNDLLLLRQGSSAPIAAEAAGGRRP